MGERLSGAATKLLAVAVLIVAGWILLNMIVGFISAILWIVIAVAAVIAVIWALRVL